MVSKRKTREDTVQGQKARAKRRDQVVEVPDGITLDNDEEMIVWEQFTASRSADVWRDFDLVIIAKMVKLEVRIRKIWEEIDEIGFTTINQRGTEIENPLLRSVDTLQRQQLAMMRGLSLGVSSEKAVSQNNTGKKSSEKAKKAEDIKQQNVMKLLG